MPNISIRGVEQHTVDELKRIAASNGRSMQAELRILLQGFAALPWETRLADWPISMLPLPRWYVDLVDVRTDFVGLGTDQLPPRRSPFRALTVPEGAVPERAVPVRARVRDRATQSGSRGDSAA